MAKGAPVYTWRTAIMDSDLPPGARHVAHAIHTYLSERQMVAWPSQARLAHDTGISDRTVRRHLIALESAGFLRREKRSGKTDLIHAVTPDTMSGVPRTPLPATPDTMSDELSKELGSVSQETSPAKVSRKRDPLWDVFTEELYPAVTANERGRRNAALKQIREALSDPAAGFLIAVRDVNDPSELESLWAGELRARIARYRVRFPGVACTETAIASHWSALAGPNGRPAQPPCPECEMGGGQHAADCSQISVGSVT